MYIKYVFIVVELQNKNMLYEVVKIHAALLYPFHLCCVIKQTISCEWDKASVLPVIIRLHSHRL